MAGTLAHFLNFSPSEIDALTYEDLEYWADVALITSEDLYNAAQNRTNTH